MNQPQAAKLLASAKKDVLKLLLPNLSQEYHYNALMIANAIQISIREIIHGEQTTASNEAILQVLTPLAIIGKTNPLIPKDIAVAIRSGEFDKPQERNILLGSLLEITHNNLTISNPKKLRQQL